MVKMRRCSPLRIRFVFNFTFQTSRRKIVPIHCSLIVGKLNFKYGVRLPKRQVACFKRSDWYIRVGPKQEFHFTSWAVETSLHEENANRARQITCKCLVCLVIGHIWK